MLVLILPMRNGNNPVLSIVEIGNGSYPTYEEWKLFTLSISTSFIESSYPTYEEWKRATYNSLTFNAISFLSYL